MIVYIIVALVQGQCYREDEESGSTKGWIIDTKISNLFMIEGERGGVLKKRGGE